MIFTVIIVYHSASCRSLLYTNQLSCSGIGFTGMLGIVTLGITSKEAMKEGAAELRSTQQSSIYPQIVIAQHKLTVIVIFLSAGL